MNEKEKGNIRADLEKIVFQNNLFNSSLNTIFEKLHTAHEFLENKIKMYEICTDWDAEALRDLSTLGAMKAFINNLTNECDTIKGRQDELMNVVLYVIEQPYKVPNDLMKELWEKI